MNHSYHQSLLQCSWHKKEINYQLSRKISEKYNLPYVISSLLTNHTDIDYFLYPTLKDHFCNPNLVSNIENVVNKILSYKKKKIMIFGDYDVDGSSSTAMLYLFLTKAGFNCDFYIPDRLSDGYGPTIDNLQSLQCDLMIFLDCGTNSVHEIEYLSSKGIEVIVIDHHKGNEIANALIINPKLFNDELFLQNLCTAGLVLVLLVAINQKLKSDRIENYLYLAALGTVCDLVPLIGFNRLIVKKGIEQLQNHSLSYALNLKKVSSYTIGFKIGPVLNAGSRMGDSKLATQFLIDNDLSKAARLKHYNEERKTIQEMFYNSIISTIDSNNKYILVYDKNFHKGVLGIIAAKLVNTFLVPAFVGYLDEQTNIVTFSIRSVETIDITQIIFKASSDNLLIKGGGHAMAGGLSISVSKIAHLEEVVKDHVETISIDVRKYYNGNISIFGIYKVQKSIHYLEPTGMKNEIPIFQVRDVSLFSRKVISNNFFSITFQDILCQKINVICFNNVLYEQFNKKSQYHIFVAVTESSIILNDAIHTLQYSQQ